MLSILLQYFYNTIFSAQVYTFKKLFRFPILLKEKLTKGINAIFYHRSTIYNFLYLLKY